MDFLFLSLPQAVIVFTYVKVRMIVWYHVLYWIVGSCILFCMRIDAPATALN